MPKAALQVIDTGTAPEFFAATLVRLERIGPCARLTFCVPRGSGDRFVCNEVILHVIVPSDQLRTMAALLARGPAEMANADENAAAPETATLN